ncbi:MAG TPA: glycosyltransferase [Verrucomicrobiales bacterium]|nr:glycosyltransferase [Verrucomicrobiales bacterium]HRJ08509.1 glycosyltransferase family 4 protein [Prosthecobacter sp.]HRK14170.1 glycosyltransferase family 4 protein [Prosthecobacter sp.]
MSTRLIHVWAPGIRQGSGGIQAFSRDAVRALLAAYPEARLHVHVKNDAPGEDDPLFAERVTWSSSRAFHRVLRTLHFALSGILRTLLMRPCLVLSTHVNFLSAVHLLKPGACRTAVVLHGIDAWNLRAGAKLRALRKTDAVISVSRFTRDQVAKLPGMEGARMFVLPNTFQTGAFQPGPKPEALLERHGLKAGQPVLLTVSRLEESERYKGHQEVIECLPELLKEFPGLRYVIAGRGGYAAELKRLVKKHAPEEAVIFAGFVSNTELADYYRLCDVFVMPSRGEGFGIVFLEALACGKPVVAGNADGSADAVDQGRLGVLVNPQSREELTEALRSLLAGTHPNRLLFEPAKLHEDVVRQFGPEAFRGRLKAILDEIWD